MRVVIVEDQIMFREFVRSVVEKDLELQVVGEASDGVEALEICAREVPDMVILDILIPRLSGLQVARSILGKHKKCKILALSAEHDPSTLHQLHALGVHGYVDKTGQQSNTLRRAICEVLEGKSFYTDVMLDTVQQMDKAPFSFHKILTPRESEILSFVGGGLTDNEIGKIVGLSASSIQSHRRNLMQKLDVHSTPELIQFAQEKGFWKPDFNRMQLTHTYHVFK
jgi:DNA-binding NarL/FixJ family response regulator